MGAGERIAIGDVARLDLPHRRIVIAVQQRLVIAVGRGVPAAELLLSISQRKNARASSFAGEKLKIEWQTEFSRWNRPFGPPGSSPGR